MAQQLTTFIFIDELEFRCDGRNCVKIYENEEKNTFSFRFNFHSTDSLSYHLDSEFHIFNFSSTIRRRINQFTEYCEVAGVLEIHFVGEQ